ncbi:MAG: hypothetical protein JKY65_30475 [Planctomycetes bacterium]|nr:hypothetical protein [Planctomycetota bacterium]
MSSTSRTLSLAFLCMASLFLITPSQAQGKRKAKLADRTILIVPFKGAKKSLVKMVADTIKKAYGVKVEVLEKKLTPSKKGSKERRRFQLENVSKMLRINPAGQSLKALEKKVVAALKKNRSPVAREILADLARPQYDLDVLIEQARTATAERMKDKMVRGVVAVTHHDVGRGDLNFLFAGVTKGVSVISYARFKDRSAAKVASRLKKQALSTGGYLVALPQCKGKSCARTYPGSIPDQDKKPSTMCKACRAKLDELWDTSKPK